jgi:hypothetical protein
MGRFDRVWRMLQDPINSVILFVILCVSAAVGFIIHPRLPERHRSAQSIALVQLAITLLVTFTAIVLGLLTTSVKAGFDRAYSARGDYAGQLAQMDRCLRDYGPETAHSREQLRSYVAAVIASTWPDEPPPKGVAYPDTSKMPLTGEVPVLSDLVNDIGLETRSLDPADAIHKNLAAACVQQYRDLIEARWKVVEGARGSITPAFYWVLAFWLAILFGAFGLTASPNPLVVTIIALCALSITVAVFVILDMDEPYGGLFGVPSTSMRNALDDMTR